MLKYRTKEEFAERRHQIIELIKEGLSVKAVAEQFKVGTAEIYRVIRLERKKGKFKPLDKTKQLTVE